MALKQSQHALGYQATPIPFGPSLCACRMSYTLTADLAASDIIHMGFLPANCVPVDLILDNDDLDSSTTGTVSAGLLNDAKDNLTGSAWLTTASVQTAANGARADAAGLYAMSRLAATNSHRAVGLKIVGETNATTGTIGLTLIYRAV